MPEAGRKYWLASPFLSLITKFSEMRKKRAIATDGSVVLAVALAVLCAVYRTGPPRARMTKKIINP